MSNKLPLSSFGDICGFVRGPFGGSLKKSMFKESGHAVYEQQHAIYNQFSEIRYFIDDEKFDEMKRFELFAGDLIMSCSGTIGKVSIVPEDIQKGIINQALLKITPSEKIDINFLKYWMDSENFKDSIAKYSKGVAVKNVASVKVLKEIKVPTPKIEYQKQIVAILDKAFEAIDKAKANLEKNIQNTKELFQSRLNEIFSQQGEAYATKTINDVCTNIFAGGDLPKGNYSKERTDKFIVPIYANGIKNKGLYGFTDIVKVENPSITISARGTIGYSEIRREPFYPIVRLIVLIPNCDIVDISFMQYCIQGIDFKNTGTSIPQLTVPMVKKYEIPIIPIKEQKNIVNELDNLKEQTRQLENYYQQKLENLEEFKKSILQKAFSGELV